MDKEEVVSDQEEVLRDICDELGMTYSNSPTFHRLLINRIEELVSTESDYMEESDYKDKYDDLISTISDISSELSHLSSRLDDVASDD